MTTTRPHLPTVLRLRGPADVAAAIPHLVGFHPEESLVVVGLCGGRTRGTVRVDLAALEQALLRPACSSEVTPHATLAALQRGGVESIVGAVVCEQHRGDHHVVEVPECPPMRRDVALPHSDVAVEVRAAAEALGLAVQEIILVQRGRWWSYLCGRACCPPDGRLIPAEDRDRVAAAFALEGERPLRDRAELTALVAPAADSVRAAVAECRTTGCEPASAVTMLLDAAARRDSRLSPEQTACALVMLDDVGLRDRLITRGRVADDPAAVLDLACELLRNADEPGVAPAASVVAALALCLGKGSLANVALDRGLAADPTHGLCVLLDQAARAGLPPDLVAAVFADAARALGE